MSQAARQLFTFDDYVLLEEMSTVRHEFLNGEVWAMAGGSPDHAAIAANVIRLLGNALSGRPCRVHTSDLRVRVARTGLGTYPDATVICGRVEIDLWRRTGRGWTHLSYREDESVRLDSLDCTLSVDDIYFDPLAMI